MYFWRKPAQRTTSLTLGSDSPPPPDAIYAAVQPAGEAAATKMVPGHLRQGAKEDGSGAHAGRSGSQAQDVQLPGVEGPQSCL